MSTPTVVAFTGPELTRTCQDPAEFTTGRLLAALEQAWAAIRAHHPDVPAAVVIVSSGSPTKASQSLTYGHFATLRWQDGDRTLPEVMVSGEGLTRTPAEVFTTLLHEAAHGLADSRDIKDTSRQGRWHNTKFAKLAGELGMTTEKDARIGYSPCTLTDTATDRYATVIDGIGAALGAYRKLDLLGPGKGRTNNNNGVTLECVCPRKLRLSVTAYEDGPIFCPVCSAWFLPEDIDRDDFTDTHPIPGANGGVDQAVTPTDAGREDPMVFYDPTGARYGLPTYPFKLAPAGLATIRQLTAQGLRPGGQQVAAQILWRHGERKAFLYRIDLAKPKRKATPAQLAALAKATRARLAGKPPPDGAR